MEDKRIINSIIETYTYVVRKAVDREFKFPKGGHTNIKLSEFLARMKKEYGSVTAQRLVDYCIFQIYKNRGSNYQSTLAVNSFGATAFKKYKNGSSKEVTYYEDKWLEENEIERESLYDKNEDHSEHPQAKYIYMPSEEITKRRFIGTDAGFFVCCESTLMWSPFSESCSECCESDKCKLETRARYPELYRIRIENYDKKQRQRKCSD